MLKQADSFNTIGGGSSAPILNTIQSGDNLVLSLKIPGVRPDAYQVFTHHDELVLIVLDTPVNESATWKEDGDIPRFIHKMEIPDYVERENIEALYEDGVLRVILPSRNRSLNKTRQINVKQI